LKPRLTAAELLALELPDSLCGCDTRPSHDPDGSPMWKRACVHVQEYAPGDLEPEEWYATFPDLEDWIENLWEVFGEEYEDRPELDRPYKVLTRVARVSLMAKRQRQGLSIWNPKDIFDLEGGGVEATGKKRKGIVGKVVSLKRRGDDHSKSDQ